MSTRQSIHISTVDSFLNGCRKQGVNPIVMLSKIGVSPEILDNPDGRFPTSGLGELLAAISQTLEDETLGFLERPTRPGGLQMWVHSCITARTLQEAIERWTLYWSLIHDDQLTVLSSDGDQVKITFTFREGDDAERSSFITWLMFLVLRLASWLIGKPLLLDRMHFNFPEPADPSDHMDMFPTRHYYNGGENSIAFNKRFLPMDIVRSATNVPDFVNNFPHLMLVQRVDLSLTAQVRRMLQAVENVDKLPLADVAKSLNRSEDTVRRHLKSEGSTFSEIKESVRRDLAMFHLESLGTPINQIAHILGFSEPSAFNRAFKRWTGQTPSCYRRQLTKPKAVLPI